MQKRILILIFFFLAIQNSFAQTGSAKPAPLQIDAIRRLDSSTISPGYIDSTVTELMAAAKVMGFGLTIINDNKIVFERGYGYRDKEKNELLDTSSVMYGASLSKAVFAYIVMQLVQEGIINLDKPVWAYLNKPLPLYEGYNDLADDPRWKLITVRDCLRHSTGFPNWRWLNPRGNNELQLFFVPGTMYAYSGEGMTLLQIAVEEASGKKLEDLAEERVFKPVGMVRTSYVWKKEFADDVAFGYDSTGQKLKRKIRSKANAAGSIETTIADYSRFIEAVMQGRGLIDSVKKKMISPQIPINTKRQFPSLNTDTAEHPYKDIGLSYGLGWGVFKCPYGNAFFKEGHDDGWAHYNVNFPDKKISIVMMSNSANAEGIFKEVLEKIIGDVFTPWDWENYQPYKPSVFPVVNNIPIARDTSLKQYVGIYAADTVNAVVALEDGKLKIALDKGGLQKSTMNMDRPDFFSLEMAAIQFQFARDAAGKIEKMIIISGKERHEFRKIN